MNAEPAFPLPGRFRLLLRLVIQPRTPTELATLEGKHLSDVSRMLKELRIEGLVEATPSGSREIYYRPTRDGYTMYAMISSRIR